MVSLGLASFDWFSYSTVLDPLVQVQKHSRAFSGFMLLKAASLDEDEFLVVEANLLIVGPPRALTSSC